MIYSAFIIPLIVILIGYHLFKKEVTIPEMLINFGATSLIIISTYFIIKETSCYDVEYNGHIITEARYYEEYETYIRKTCTRKVSCGVDNKGNTKYCDETYDCSYCDYHPKRYELVDTDDNSFTISKDEYLKFVKRWNQTPQFVDLNRNINYVFSCGKDGDMYKVVWDGKENSSVMSTTSISYKNVLQYGNSAFDYQPISKERAKIVGLYDYPEIDNYYQPTVLGLNKTTLSNKNYLIHKIDYFNGNFGKKLSNRVFVLIFLNKPKEIAKLQEDYWFGGNRNEVVLCIGIDDKNDIKWVKPFSWNKDKSLIPFLREDVRKVGNLKNVDQLYEIIKTNNEKYFKWRDFDKDFSYLSFQLSTGQMIIIYLITLIVSIIIMVVSIQNEYKNKD